MYTLEHINPKRHVPPLVTATTRGVLNLGQKPASGWRGKKSRPLPYSVRATKSATAAALDAPNVSAVLDAVYLAHNLYWHITQVFNDCAIPYPHFARSKPVDWDWQSHDKVSAWTYTPKFDGTRTFVVCVPEPYLVTDAHGILTLQSHVPAWLEAGTPCIVDAEHMKNGDIIVFDVLVWKGKDTRQSPHEERIAVLGSHPYDKGWCTASYLPVGGTHALRQLIAQVDTYDTNGVDFQHDGIMLYDPQGRYGEQGTCLKVKPRTHMTVDLYTDTYGDLFTVNKKGDMERIHAQHDVPAHARANCINEYFVAEASAIPHLEWRRVRNDKTYPNATRTVQSILNLCATRDTSNYRSSIAGAQSTS